MTWEWSSRSGVYVQVGSYFFCVLLLELQHHFATFLWSFELGTVRLRTLYTGLVLCNRDADSGRLCQAPNLFQRIGVEGGGLAQCPDGCGAFVVSCLRGVGSDTSSGCLSQQRGPFSSRSTTRSKGETRREKKIILKIVRALAEDKREKREIQRCRDNPYSKEEQ